MQKKEMDKQVILYGAGHVAENIIRFLQYQGIVDCLNDICVTYGGANILHGKTVKTYEECKEKGLSFLIGVAEGSVAFQEIETRLRQDGQKYYRSVQEWEESVGIRTYERDYVAYAHIESVYYDRAEGGADAFWRDGSRFRRFFDQMDPAFIVELACGHGRHVPHYINKATEVTLVDILQKNIDFCRERFVDKKNVYYCKNNGHDLKGLPDEKYTSLFTYDAMVHFEMMDIAEYLSETQRILVPGGMALFHHSNLDTNYEVTFRSNRHGRAFMSRKLFAYLAHRVGLKIVEQQIFDWGGVVDLDCLTLVRKL